MPLGHTIALIATGVLASCSEPKEQSGPPPPPPAVSVMAIHKKRRDAGDRFRRPNRCGGQGRVACPCPGFLETAAVHRGSGREVPATAVRHRAGTVQAAVTQAEADLASAEADAQNAKLQFERAAGTGEEADIPSRPGTSGRRRPPWPMRGSRSGSHLPGGQDQSDLYQEFAPQSRAASAWRSFRGQSGRARKRDPWR